MENIFNVSVVLPIKTSTSKDFDELFNKAITSIKEQKTQVNELVIVHTDEELLMNLLNEYDFGTLNVKKVLWDKEPNYAYQMNYGIENASSEWISFFEFDDEYSSIWFKNVKKYQTDGMLIKKSEIESFGGFKTNFKLTFVYEFLLRLTFNSVKVLTIPKIGYKHINLREGSIFWNYKYGSDILSEDEVRFWIDSAKKEHFFKDERLLKYEPSI